MGNELMTKDNWMTLKEQATMLVRSGFLPFAINTPEKALAVCLAGRELGIGMMESFRSINVIQGKPTISPQLMLALAYRTGEVEDIKMDTGTERAIVTIKRKGKSEHTEVFGIKEATDMGLIDKDNYKKQASTMFKWRALAACLRVTFPDVVLGVYTPEELGAEVKVVDDNMEVVSIPKQEPPQIEKQSPSDYAEEADSSSPIPLEKPKPVKPKKTGELFEISSVPMSVEKRESKKSPGKFYYAVKDWQGIEYLTYSETLAEFCRKAMDENKLLTLAFEDKMNFKKLASASEQTIGDEKTYVNQ